ncbi:hypothetical protein HYW94_04070 [Candidatus Uhrbacteria bacterium]|nr:hypothetical protein [Candidatus Uhrbacteria bacterium]
MILWSILSVVGASVFAYLSWWACANFEKFSDGDSDNGGYGIFLLFLITLFPFGTGVLIHGWFVQCAWTLVLTVLACGGQWMHENWTWGHSARMKEILMTPFNYIANLANSIWQNITRNDVLIRRYAKKRVNALRKLMPGPIWSDMREQIASIGITALSSLLERRNLLEENISVTERVIRKYEKNLSSDVMHQLHASTLADMEKFQQELAKTETQIGDIVGFLDEVESDVRMALISDDGHAELDKRLLQFAGTIQSVKAEERVVEQELQSYLGHTAKPLSEDSDSAPHTQIPRLRSG